MSASPTGPKPSKPLRAQTQQPSPSSRTSPPLSDSPSLPVSQPARSTLTYAPTPPVSLSLQRTVFLCPYDRWDPHVICLHRLHHCASRRVHGRNRWRPLQSRYYGHQGPFPSLPIRFPAPPRPFAPIPTLSAPPGRPPTTLGARRKPSPSRLHHGVPRTPYSFLSLSFCSLPCCASR